MRTLTGIIYPGETGRWLVAYNPETGTTTQGQMVGQALANLKEATALYLEEGGKTELIYGLTRLAACQSQPSFKYLGCAAGFQEIRDVGKGVLRCPHQGRLAILVLR
jgi:predicted RNase H-like HicB family nuclease